MKSNVDTLTKAKSPRRSNPVQRQCKVADLASDAAATLRTMVVLNPPPEGMRAPALDGPKEKAVRTLFEGENCAPSKDFIRSTLHARLDALRHAALSERAHSWKGAVFQAYLAAHEVAGITVEVDEHRIGKAAYSALRETEEKVERLLYSCVSALESERPVDDDLFVLRCWYLSPEMDVGLVVERAAQTLKAA